MRKARIYILLGLCVLCTHLLAVPAYPDWVTTEQPDGSMIEIRAIGDEFYHYWINIDGQEVIQDEAGWWVVAPEQATSAQRKARRAASPMLQEVEELRKAPVSPMPTKMLVILVSFSDRAILSSHDNAFFDNWLNGEDNQPYGSAWEYFHTTSDGKYSPHWDVYGPVVLDSTMAYYGGNDSSDDDIRPRQMAFEACEKADALGCDFSQYDANNDGTVDNVYIIYAGYAESSCSSSWPNAIWPHSWTMGIYATHTIDGKKLSKYGCSAELDNCSGSTPDGIGTFCHEFSHVIGMPDYYDTKYGENYNKSRTPGRWSLMDHGSYNGSGNRPPLYSIFDKCYMGWATMPAVLPKNAKVTVSMPVGSQYARHISGTTTGKNYTSTDTIYYLETRQQTGKFDYSLPGQGLVIWQVKYRSNWSTPNNEAGAPRYTLLSATGSTDGLGSGKDSYPGSSKVTKKTVWPGCELSAISYSNGTTTFKYNGGVPSLITKQESFQIVPGQTYTWRGRTLDTPGTYTDTIRSEFDDTAYVFTLSYVDPVKAIVYTGPNKLDEVTNGLLIVRCGLHTDAFGQAIAQHYFSNGIGAVIFNDTLRTVGDYAFYGCREGNSNNQVLTVTLPNTVTSIGSYAFYCCFEMEEIDLGTSIQTLGYQSLYKCYALKHLVLPESVNKLDKYALQKCTALQTITSENLTPPSCYSSTFSGLTRSNITLKVWPTGLSTYKVADEWEEFFIQPIQCDEPVVNLTRDTICQGGTYVYKGNAFKTATTYTDTTWNKYGCATNVDQLELSVLPTYSITESANTCMGVPYIWHSKTLSSSGVYFDSLTSQFGCDSICMLTLNVQPIHVSEYFDTEQIFEGDSIEWRGKFYREEGLYADTAFYDYSCEMEIYQFELNIISNMPTGLDSKPIDQSSSNETRKHLYQNHFYIERNGIKYDAIGRKILTR